MEFKEYLKEQTKKVENDSDLLLFIYLDDKVQFKYHHNCFADFQDDFCILYDDDINMTIRYDKVTMTQCGNLEEMKEELAEIFIKSLFEKLQ